MAHEAEENPAMSESTTDIRIVPLPTGHERREVFRTPGVALAEP